MRGKDNEVVGDWGNVNTYHFCSAPKHVEAI